MLRDTGKGVSNIFYMLQGLFFSSKYFYKTKAKLGTKGQFRPKKPKRHGLLIYIPQSVTLGLFWPKLAFSA